MAKYVYIRVSTDGQGDSGVGMLAQEMKTGKIAAAHPDVFGETRFPIQTRKKGHFVDIISAYNNPFFERPAGKALFNVLDEGDTIILSRLDRGFRTVRDFCNFLAKSQKFGWNLVCSDPPIDLSTPNGRMCAMQYALMAEWESDIKGQRIKDALAAKKARKISRVAYEKEVSLESEYRPRLRAEVSETAKTRPPGKIYVYIRCSHRSSVESGLGLRYQMETCSEYADALAAENPNLVWEDDVVTDPAISALATDFEDRTYGGKLHKELKKGDIVVCLRPDRVFGSIRDMSQTLRNWKERGVDLHFAEDGMNLDSESGEMMLSIMVAFAQMERSLAKSRAKESRAALESQGKFTGGTGYPVFWMGYKSGNAKKLMLDRRQIVTFRLISSLVNRGMEVTKAVARCEELIAKREKRRPIPACGVERRGYWECLPAYYFPNRYGQIFPLWTRDRYYSARGVWDDTIKMWREKVVEEKSALAEIADRSGLHRPVMRAKRQRNFSR